MKANVILTAAMAICLLAAPTAEISASVNEESTSTLAPAKKKTTTKKSTKATSKKTTSKKSSKSTTSKTAKTTAQTAQANEEALTKAAAQAAEEKAQTSTKKSSSTGSSLLGGILSAIGGGSSSDNSSDAAGNILSGLTSIFNSSMVATKDKIIGTWTYTEPAVVFSSNNALKNIGGKVASQAIENQLQTQFEKFGIKKGAMTMTFDKNGNFTQTLAGKTLSGTYTISGKNVTLKYAGNVKQIVGTTQLDGNDLLIVMDASKLLSFANTLGSLTGNSLLKSAGNLLGSMDGMEVGLKLDK